MTIHARAGAQRRLRTGRAQGTTRQVGTSCASSSGCLRVVSPSPTFSHRAEWRIAARATYTRAVIDVTRDRSERDGAAPEPPELEVVIETPRGSFLKRGSSGRVDFVSPLPCPYNYGSVPDFIGLEGDLLDALVLGPRLPVGARVRVKVWGAVGLSDRGLYDDKLICSRRPLRRLDRILVLLFFRFYARCKALRNRWLGRPGRNACEGWCDASEALARARPRDPAWRGPSVPF